MLLLQDPLLIEKMQRLNETQNNRLHLMEVEVRKITFWTQCLETWCVWCPQKRNLPSV